jgi:DNA polymerase-3 subunit beta
MPYDNADMPAARPRLMATTAAAALAIYDAARSIEERADAADLLAAFVRASDAKPANAKPKAKAKAAAPTDTLNAENMRATLARVCTVIERRNTIPILGNVRLAAAGGALSLTGTDLDMTYSEVLRRDPGGPEFDVTVPAHQLAALLRGAAGEVEMVYDVATDPRLSVTVAGMTSHLPVLPSGDFPVMNPAKSLARFTGDVVTIRNGLAFVRPAISTEETRYYLNGAFMHVRQEAGAESLAFTATDGHRMLMCDTPNPGAPSDMPGRIIPLKAVAWLEKGLPKEGEVEVEVFDFSTATVPVAYVRFTTHVGAFTTKVIDGSYPDYIRVIPRDVGSTIAEFTDTKAASIAVTRLASISAEKSRSVRFTAADGAFTGQVRNMEAGQSTAAIPGCKVAGAPMEIGFNARYVIDMLALGEGMQMHMTESASPCRVTWADKPGCVGVIMPLRV